MSETSEFPAPLHRLAASMHMLDIDPHGIEVALPFADWWKLYCRIERQFSGLLTPAFDGRAQPVAFRYMGFLFKPTQVPE